MKHYHLNVCIYNLLEFAPPIHLRLKVRSGFKPCIKSLGTFCNGHNTDLHAVGLGEGPRALVTPMKASRVGVLEKYSK